MRAKWVLGAVGVAALLLAVRLVLPGWFVTGESGNSMLGYLASGETGFEAGPRVAETMLPAAPATAAEQRLVDLVNAARAAEGLLPLGRSDLLMADARRHSQDMAGGNYLGPEDAWGREPRARLDELGYADVEVLAINLAAGLPDADSAFEAWMADGPYRRNILDPRLREIGAGYAHDGSDTFGPYVHYWTVELGARRGVYPVVIASEAASISCAQVELAIHGQGWAREMAVANGPLLHRPYQPYQPRLAWTLDTARDESAVYVTLVGDDGVTRVISDTIRVQGRVLELRQGLYGYQGVADAAITSWDPGSNRGDTAELEIGASAWSGGSGKQALLRFDLAAVIPAATVQRATLALHLTAPPPQPLTLEVCELAAPWEEQAVTWWQSAPGILWERPGAGQTGHDRQAAPLGSWVIQPISSVVEVDVTPMIQAWIAQPERNHGLLLSSYGGSFASCAVAASEHNREEMRPSLKLFLRPDGGTGGASSAPKVEAATPAAMAPPLAASEDAPLTLTLQARSNGYSGATDTYLSADTPRATFGSAPTLLVGSASAAVALLRFDLSGLPPAILVQRAALSLYATEVGAHPVRITAYGLARAWEAGQATWIGPSSGQAWAAGGGGGPGSDRNPYPSGSATVSGAGDWVEMDVTDLLSAWMHDAQSNDGVIIRGEGESGARAAFASADHDRPDQRPRLTITYALP